MLARLQNALITSCAASRIQFRVSGSGRAEKRPGNIPGLFLKNGRFGAPLRLQMTRPEQNTTARGGSQSPIDYMEYEFRRRQNAA